MCRAIIVLVALCASTYGFPKVPIPAQKLGERIAGGVEANIEDFPYQLSLQFNGQHICGASIISAEWALTSAQCVQGANVSSVAMRAGSSVRTQGGSLHQAASIILHPRFVYREYDYAVVRVAPPFPLGSEGVQAVPLAMEEPAGGLTGVAAGWGAITSPPGGYPAHLRSVNLPIMTREYCQNLYWGFFDITDRMICAGQKEGIIDTCMGDIGGALVVDGVQVGIVSFGLGCAWYNAPGIYANVADQRLWIREATGV